MSSRPGGDERRDDAEHGARLDESGESTRRHRPVRFGRRLLAMLVVLPVVLFLVRGCIIEPGSLVERDYTFALPHWSPACDGLRVDLVSDLHVGSPHNGLPKFDRLVRRLVQSNADAVVMTGDYVILSVLLGTYIPADVVARHLRPLTAQKPVYAVLGNHDWWKDGDRVRAALESAGVVVLEDQARAVTLGQCRLWMVGVGDYLEAPHDVGRAFAPVDNARKSGDRRPVLAMTHNPQVFPEMPDTASLVLAGHTHGGQIVFPVIGAPGLWRNPDGRYRLGHYTEGGRQLFVSPGIGTSILPIRFGVPPEISRLTLRSSGKNTSKSEQ